VLTGILILFIVLTTMCGVLVLQHSRQGAINRAFGAFALVCLICLALPIALLDPLLKGGREVLLLTLYGACYLFAPAAFIPLPLTIYWSSWRREHRTLYRFLLLAPAIVAIVLFLVLINSALRDGDFGGLQALPADEAFRELIPRPFDQGIRRGFSAVMELCLVALLLPRVLRGRTRVERHTALTLLAASVLTSAFARFSWASIFGDFAIAGAIISLALCIRLLVCYQLLVRYRLFSRADVGIELAIQRMADGFILVDEHMRVQTFNPAALYLLPALARGRALPELPSDALVHPLEPQEQPVRIVEDGRTLSLDWSTITDRRGLPRGAILLLRDITEHEALAATRAEVEMLQELNRFKADVIRTMRHELRTPLTAILGYSGALLVHETVAERREFLDIIRGETKRLSRMIEDFLDMSSIQAGNMRYNLHPLDLAERCAQLPARFLETRSTHPLTIDMPPKLPPAQADADRIDQVLSNLVGNAIKYSPSGGPVQIEAQVWDRPAPEAPSNGRCWLRVTVRDQGLGLPPDAHAKIFDRFYRIEDDERYSIRGTGLGLAICKEIVQAHGGAIWAESDGPGQGSAFSFTLPTFEGKSSSPG
jgi:signal transduction histidine kinase